MSKSYQFVPWFNSSEWHDVYNKLYSSSSTNETRRNALDVLYVWKARSPSLPSGIESTLSLLEVHLQDIEEMQSDYLIRLAYSTALMRYVNHILDRETARGSSLFNAAKSRGVPDWIVELRHDTAHGNKLPPLELLRQATQESLEWLQKNYWDEYKEFISDYITSSETLNESQDGKIAALLNFCVSLSIYTHSKSRIKKVYQLSDTEIRDSLVSDAIDVFGDNISVTKSNKISISALNSLMNIEAKKLFCNDVSPHMKKTLLSEDSLFLSYEVYYLFHDSKNKNNCLNTSYVECFQGLLHFLHSHDILLPFVLELINVSHSDNDNKRCKLAAQWVSVILKALKKYQQFVDRMKEFQSGVKECRSKEENELKSLYYHWYPNEKQYPLLLNLQKPIPLDLTDVKFIQSVVSTYNPYLTFFVRELLSLCQPPLPPEVVNKLSELADLLAFPEKFPVVSSGVYTTDDFKIYKNPKNPSTMNQSKDDMEITSEIMEVEISGSNDCGIWQLASDSHHWSTCPIGILPWQLPQNNKYSKDNEI